MNVKNRKCIWKLSWRSLWASRKRNIIAIIAIALTTLLFTSLFTIIMSINSSYENYTFRQVGGYCHGTFKEVTEKQIQKIAAHSNIKEIGITKTETEILKDIALGMTTKEIAEKRFSSFHTVNTHRKNIFRKLGVNNVHEATKYALRAGLVDSAEYYI